MERMSQSDHRYIYTPRVFWFPFIQSFLEKEKQKPRENLEENKPTKVHVYSFGVVLYEIIMGRSTIKPMEPSAENILLEWIKLYDVDSKSFRMIVDSSLRSKYPVTMVNNITLILYERVYMRIYERGCEGFDDYFFKSIIIALFSALILKPKY
uniref:Protein kinase-related n=1 Tax=Brassica oleracea TaxID=3712 RepID=Q2A9U8_BRAOL|nr:protein kinase -related [Brassica oleracea]